MVNLLITVVTPEVQQVPDSEQTITGTVGKECHEGVPGCKWK